MEEQMNETQAQEFQNVAESAQIYDTVIVCPTFYGQEGSVEGWFSAFQNFAAQERHSFFKTRNEATASLAYCNKQSIDTLDFPLEAYSFGVAFWAPSTRVLACADYGSRQPNTINTQLAHWWEVEFPRHCSIELKVQQDTVLELPALAASPGYGPCGGGASFEHEQCFLSSPQGSPGNQDYLPVMNMSVTQGMPELTNRWPLTRPGKKAPVGIPRTGVIEAILTVSEYARWYLSQISISPHLIIGGGPQDPPQYNYNYFPARFGIQVSIVGKRLVQQRAQYHNLSSAKMR